MKIKIKRKLKDEKNLINKKIKEKIISIQKI